MNIFPSASVFIRKSRQILVAMSLGASTLLLVSNSLAANLTIGLAADISSLDPHYFNSGPNMSLSSHLFDPLVAVDANGNLVPGLAVSWRAVDPTTWEFKLRRGVKFHDGSDFTADDVIFSLDRPATVLNSPGPFTSNTKQIIAKQVIDPYTVRLKTATPYGPLPLDLTSIFIVSKKAAAGASSDDFNSGKALVGTGPFKLAQFKRGESIELVRNPNYWGQKEAGIYQWDKVTFRILTADAARVTALLAGSVDAIENVPTADLPQLRKNPKLKLEQKVSWRSIFWTLDQSRDSSPDITDKSGKPLEKNPFKDIRVRQAISKAINRQALVERTLEGLAIPASNLNSPGVFGHNDALKVETYDPEGAKKLLAEAGYPNGFALTLHGPNNRYINDDQIVQTVAQFLSRIGIQTKVETLPLATYFGKAKAHEYSFALLGWGSLGGDLTLRTLLGTANPQTGWGTFNWGQYSNPKADQLIQTALSTVDEKQRNKLTQEAAALVVKDYAVIPSHYQYASWALRKGLKYPARTDEFTLAQYFQPEQ